ncbi:phage major capsid protein [Rhodopirellula bahusiensis]|uniref:phage major capsid protein n=3 Tax=Rhodopirellula bahusiensis TaxID=2014065 RepID=UPI0032637613
MSILQDLQDKRNDLASKIRELGNKCDADKGWPDSETKQNWDKLNSDYDAVLADMEAKKSADSVTNRLNKLNELQNSIAQDHRNIGGGNASPGMHGGRGIGVDGASCTEEHRALAMAAWMRNQMGGEVTPEMEDAAKLAGVRVNQKSLNFESASTHWLNGLAQQFQCTHPSKRRGSEFYNAPLTTQTAGTGGNVVAPETLMRQLEINMLSFSPMSQFAELMVTQTGETLSWPTVDDTDHTGEQIGENSDLSNSGAGGDAPDFAKAQWDAYKLSSKMILVPYELLEDNVVNLPAVLGQLMGERIGRLRNQRYTTGSGSGQATGVVTAATLGVTAASETAITADEVIDLQHSVDPAYRNDAQFMCNDSIVKYLRKLKDANDGQYLWQSGMQAGVPDSLYGSTLVVNQDMSSTITAEDKTLLYGQLSKYKIRRVNGFRMYRLTERYRDTDQDGFMMLLREDGNLLDAGTAPVKFLQQKAAA